MLGPLRQALAPSLPIVTHGQGTIAGSSGLGQQMAPKRRQFSHLHLAYMQSFGSGLQALGSVTTHCQGFATRALAGRNRRHRGRAVVYFSPGAERLRPPFGPPPAPPPEPDPAASTTP